jgi:Family of unknown function (DUF5947)
MSAQRGFPPPARPSGDGGSPLGTLRRFVRPRERLEQCEICSVAIPPDPNHRHLLDTTNRQILCACDACALSLGNAESAAGSGESAEHSAPPRRYRLIPRRVHALPDFEMTDAIWDGVLIPVGMAFFFFNSAEGKMMAYYPSPAGPTESLLSPDAWEAIIRANPDLAAMEPDVEALLVNRVRGAHDYYRVPIDECYRLVGLVRLYWQGLSGGAEVWEEIGTFFADLTRRSGPTERTSYA